VKNKVKKIVAILVLVLIMGFNCLLSACSLVTINNTKYLAQKVVTSDNVSINMEDLILGYNSFGYSYIETYGMTAEEAVKKTIEDLIDRELLVAYAKDKYGELSITEQNEIYTEVYASINSQVKEYADEIVEDEGLILPEENESEEQTNENKVTFYEKKVERVKNQDGSYTYSRIKEEEKPEDTNLIEFVLEEYGIEGLATRAYSKYINAAKKSRDEYKKLTNDEVFDKEVDRIYKIFEKNKYVEKLQEDYEDNVDVDTEAILNKYKELVRNSAFTYALNESGYNTKMQSTSNEIYYQPFGEKYIQVAHILVKYNDEQTKQIEKLKTDLKQGYIDIEEYNQQVLNISKSVKAKEYVDGSLVETTKSVNALYNEIQSSLNACGNDDDLRLQTFINYIEKYNEDEGMLTAINSQTQYYAVNLDTTVTDTMVKEFADASRALYSADGSTDYTLYAEPVLTEYGYHIIFSLGTIKNEITLNNIENVTISYLFETDAMQGTNKSLFDKMFELVESSNFEEYQSALLLNLRSNKTFKYNKTAYERLYK